MSSSDRAPNGSDRERTERFLSSTERTQSSSERLWGSGRARSERSEHALDGLARAVLHVGHVAEDLGEASESQRARPCAALHARGALCAGAVVAFAALISLKPKKEKKSGKEVRSEVEGDRKWKMKRGMRGTAARLVATLMCLFTAHAAVRPSIMWVAEQTEGMSHTVLPIE